MIKYIFVFLYLLIILRGEYKIMKYGEGVLFPNFKKAWLRIWDESLNIKPRAIYLVLFGITYYCVLFLMLYLTVIAVKYLIFDRLNDAKILCDNI